jgi:hypothetical protein
MIFKQPVTLSEAAKGLQARSLMPTSLDSNGIRQLDAWLRSQSFFSAQTTNQYLLQRYKDLVGNILEPQLLPGGGGRETYNQAYAREEITSFLESIGYVPPQDKAGTIEDLSSDARINLVLETNEQMAQGAGWWLQGQDEAILDAFPAQELFRAEDRKQKREWLERFRLAGQQTGDPIGTGWTITPEFRMIALKNHEIWKLLGSSKLFPDGLDQPWPPFAFNSGMDVRDVDRQTAQDLGLIEPGESVEPMTLEEAA